ncbi:acyl-CoA thioesterase [Pararhizobium mangrovi]|uniref:Acyl-CoA thioesterase 2 n=1 Tax=Pararhizobium mangrovi TaxID=2590452 RepID=A0A506U386_9HYPH|nr:acyl-CoA thioesterase II [Pararhizobium mangrovi]TPW27741.1 acyl-CoA thioesterase II [Pararhizobium mangrovi]
MRSVPSSGTPHDMVEILDLEIVGDDRFRGFCPPTRGTRIFGGQVVAQALAAAQKTVPEARSAHSLHGYFMLGGDPAVPIDFVVERMRDGRSFSTRRIVALQAERCIFSMAASFQIEEEGFEHAAVMPDVPEPEALESGTEIVEAALKRGLDLPGRMWLDERPMEFRPVTPEHYVSTRRLPPEQHLWLRMTGPLPADAGGRAATLAYLSDMALLDTALFAHGTSVFADDLQAASLDHAVWFHRPPPLEDWLLYTADSPTATGARGLARGMLFSRDGLLVASTAQEGLIRKRANA